MQPRLLLPLTLFSFAALVLPTPAAESGSHSTSGIAVQLASSPRRRVVTLGNRVTDHFRDGARGWTAGFSDYSLGTDGLELDSGIRPLPPELQRNETAFLLSGHNRSDDLFMFLKKKLTTASGLRPNHDYELSFRIVFASNAGSGCSGIGGAPGESVTLKAGGTTNEPQVELIADLTYRMNVDKGNQITGGPAASVVGNIANGRAECSAASPFVTLERRHIHPTLVRTNAQGELWILVGTDSGFEGKTSIYYQEIEVGLRER